MVECSVNLEIFMNDFESMLVCGEIGSCLICHFFFLTETNSYNTKLTTLKYIIQCTFCT